MKEDQFTELKRSWRDDWLEWICGFASAGGGSLYVGVDDNGNAYGVANCKKLLEDIPNKMKESLGILGEVNYKVMDGKDVIKIVVPPYPAAISYKGAYYMRSGATNQRLTGASLDAFLMKKRGANWESIPIRELTMNDIDDGVINSYITKAQIKKRLSDAAPGESNEDFIKKMHVMRGEWLTNAAALLFTKDPELWITGAYLKVGYFESDANLVYQDEVRGPIFEQIDKAVELIYFKYLKAKISYKGIQRIERYPFPQDALREALLNAVVHKDYSSGTPIQISVYADKLYIGNCGHLPETWTVENLMGKHVSKPYNPIIAQAFFLLGYIESWGRGVKNMCDACEADGLPMPEYTVHPDDIMIKFTAPANRIIKGTEDDQTTHPDTHPDRKTKEEITSLILAACVQPKTRDELMKLSNLKDKHNFRHTYINPLLESGQLQMTLPNTPNSKNQKYVAVMRTT